MRLLIINRIMLLLCMNRAETEMDLRGNRFSGVYEFVRKHNEPGWNAPHRYKERIFLTAADLDMLADDRLVELFETVTIRAYRQM